MLGVGDVLAATATLDYSGVVIEAVVAAGGVDGDLDPLVVGDTIWVTIERGLIEVLGDWVRRGREVFGLISRLVDGFGESAEGRMSNSL
jgi:hypothetical protein